MHIFVRPSPVSLKAQYYEVSEGLSLYQGLKKINLGPEFWSHGVAVVGDEVYDKPEAWPMIKPKSGVPVNMHILPGNPKGALRSILPFATVIAQFAIGATNPFLGALIGIGGGLLMSALAPKPKAPKSQSNKQLGQGGFAANQLKPWDQIPTVFGRKRISPSQLAPPRVKVNGDNVYWEAVVGLAGRHAVSQIKINGADPPDDVEIHVREGDEFDGDLEIYTTTTWQQEGRKLPRHAMKSNASNDNRYELQHSNDGEDEVIANDMPQEVKHRIGDGPDRVIIDYQFSQGLAKLAGGKAGVPIRTILYSEDPNVVPFVLPECHIHANWLVPFRAKMIIEWALDPGGNTPGGDDLWRKAYASTDSMEPNKDNTEANVYFGTGNAADHSRITGPTEITIFLDPASVPKGKWTVGIKIGAGYREDRFLENTNMYGFDGAGGLGVEPQWFGYHNDGGNFKATENQSDVMSEVILEQIISEWDEVPFNAAGLCTVEIRAKNLQIESLSFIAERYVRHAWDGSGFAVAPQISQNNAELMYMVLTDDDLNAKTLPTEIIDDVSLGEWQEFCVANEHQCNAYIESGTVEDALQILTHSGFAALRRSETWGVYIDKDRSSDPITQTYSPRNMRGFRAERGYDEVAHAYKVSFDDETDDYQTAERIVYRAGYDSDNAILVEAKNAPGITKPEKIDQRFRHDLLLQKYRRVTYSCETDAQYLVSDRGARVKINTPAIFNISGSARIINVHRNVIDGETKIVRVDVDDELQMLSTFAGSGSILDEPDILGVEDILGYGVVEPTGVAIQNRKGEEILATTTQINRVRFIQFEEPLDDNEFILPGCLVFVGEPDEVSHPAIVTNVRPGSNLSARLMMIDDASELLFV